MMNELEKLNARIQKLEDIEAIKCLKARYFRVSDAKDPEGMRSCYADDATVDFDTMGQFDADGIVSLFRDMGCVDQVVDMHRGANPEIVIDESTNGSNTAASGTWAMTYFTLNTQEQLFFQLGGFYEDQYIKRDNQWKILSSKFVTQSRFMGKVSDGLPAIIEMSAKTNL